MAGMEWTEQCVGNEDLTSGRCGGNEFAKLREWIFTRVVHILLPLHIDFIFHRVCYLVLFYMGNDSIHKMNAKGGKDTLYMGFRKWG